MRVGWAVLGVLGGCTFTDAAIQSVPADVVVDVGRGDVIGPDVAPDVAADAVGPDASVDVALDAPPDARVDAPIDDRVDVATDVAVDVVTTTPTSCRPATIGCGQARLPGGTFTMGDSDARGGSPLQPMITVNAFLLDRYEVTVARFRRFVDAGTPSVPGGSVMYPTGAQAWTGSSSAFNERTAPGAGSDLSDCNWTRTASDREGHPINCVSWETAQAFCVWDGGRLPTEAEWEFAARGVGNRTWPWGEAATTLPQPWVCSHRFLPTRLGTCEETDATFAMGQTPGPDLISHLIGNVWEWTADWYADYGDATCWNGTPRSNPLWYPSGQSRS